MANDNYAAWEIDASEYSEDWDDMAKLRFFCRYAVLAPSGHNTQPWRFSHRDRALIVKHDHRRLLGYSGPMAAEPHVSLGSCLETLRLAAQGFGHRVAVDYDPSAGPVATAVLSGRVDAEASLPSAIVRRTSNRHRYKLEQLSTTLLDQVTSNDLKDAQPHVVTEASDIAFLADQTEVATRQIMSDPQFRAELSDWVRSNITKRFDGMPGFVQGMPTPPSLIARQIIKRVDISKGQAKKDAGRIVNSPALVLALAREASATAMFDAGRLYARICILAQQRGIATCGIGAAAFDEESRQRITERFGLAGQPVALLRLGLAERAARHTPRWPLGTVSEWHSERVDL